MTSVLTDTLSIATDTLLAPASLESSALQNVLNSALGVKADYADLYFQHSMHESWVLEDGVVRDGSFNLERGVGVRVVSGDKTGFAYSDEIEMPALQQAASAARAIAQQGQNKKVPILLPVKSPVLYSTDNPLHGWQAKKKIELLKCV